MKAIGPHSKQQIPLRGMTERNAKAKTGRVLWDPTLAAMKLRQGWGTPVLWGGREERQVQKQTQVLRLASLAQDDAIS